MEKFWICWVEYAGKPSIKHLTFDEAKKEAERLCRKEGKSVAILEVVGYVKTKETPTQFINMVAIEKIRCV